MPAELPLPKKGTEPPIFVPFLLWPDGWMHQDATWLEVGLGPGHFVLDGTQVLLAKKGAEHPQFSACLLWPNGWVDQDGT